MLQRSTFYAESSLMKCVFCQCSSNGRCSNKKKKKKKKMKKKIKKKKMMKKKKKKKMIIFSICDYK